MKKKKMIANLILLVVFLVGLSLLLYPTFSNWWNSFHSSHAIASYVETVESLDEAEYEALLTSARTYNQALAQKGNQYVLSQAELAEYRSQLDVSGSGIMGYVEIDKLNISLPIYHGTEESVLAIAAGHVEWSSLPVGGESTHCVLSGHRGLPSAKLFTDLDQLAEGDTFLVNILDETLTYQVDQILIVEPEDTAALQITPGEDYCTLVTCTPYGVNSHRLLVRGHRIDNVAESLRVSADLVRIEPIIVAPIMATPVLLLLLITLFLKSRKCRDEPEPETERTATPDIEVHTNENKLD